MTQANPDTTGLSLSLTGRAACALVAVAALGSLALQTGVDLTAGDSLAASLWTQARYFTNLTNLAVGLGFAAAAITGCWPGASLPAAMTVWIVAVGVIYHSLLAATHTPQGWSFVANIGTHSVVPIAALGTWLAFGPRALRAVDPVLWTLWPTVYSAYALMRGATDGIYPYFFLNPTTSGLPLVASYVVGLALFFLACGYFLFAISRIRARARISLG